MSTLDCSRAPPDSVPLPPVPAVPTFAWPDDKLREKLIGTIAHQALLIREGGQRNPAQRRGLAIAEGTLDRAVGPDEIAHQTSAGEAILLRAGGRRGTRYLRQLTISIRVEQIPRKRQVSGSVGKTCNVNRTLAAARSAMSLFPLQVLPTEPLT